MKRDESPLSLRRPFVRFARTLVTPDISRQLLDALRAKHPPAGVAELLPRWNARDPQGAWAVYYAEIANAYTRIMAAAGRAARVRKDDKGTISSVERAPEIMVPTNPYSAAWIKDHAGELCVELSQQQHESVRAIVARMYDEGRRPEEIAEHVRTVVGLTSRQEEAVLNFWVRTLDETGDEDIASERAQRYADKQLVYRSEVIARNENHEALSEGRRDEWLQARDDDELPATVKRRWVSAPSSHRLCELCEGMDGQEVGLDEDYVSEDGEHFTTAHGHVQCRCTEVLVYQ